MEIKSYEFNQDGRALALSDPMGKDWPVVYLINNAKNCTLVRRVVSILVLANIWIVKPKKV